jgi:hypothetical protein
MPVYSEHKSWSQGDSVYTGVSVFVTLTGLLSQEENIMIMMSIGIHQFILSDK